MKKSLIEELPKVVAEGRVGELKETARPQLEKLERKQRFILDTLPFIRKP